MERPTDTTTKVVDIWQKVVSRADKLKVLGCLDPTEAKYGREASNILLKIQENRRRRIYKLFLHDVLRRSGSAAVLLCAIVGQATITGLKKIERTQLSNLIYSNPNAINHLAIRPLADGCHIPSSVDDILLPAAVDPQRDERSRKRARSLETANPPPEIEERGQIVDNNATLRGVNEVFNKDIANAIRRVADQNEAKAAVTMVLPLWGGPVDCYVSLDICEDEVEKLAMALFKAKVSQTQQFLRLEREGIVVNIPSSEASIGGVLGEDILEVFGSVIHAAINENPLRERELKEGKLATECVSMGFTKNGAIINLSLGLERGLQIRGELYI